MALPRGAARRRPGARRHAGRRLDAAAPRRRPTAAPSACPGLLIKDEGLIPTGSFKARGAAVGVSRARELGIRHVAMPTNGNAGAAWATYATRAGIRSTIAMPVDAPVITRNECLAAGADLHLVDGLISDAGAMIGAFVRSSGGTVFDASTLKEPYRLEGKKTMGYEIVEQLGWTMPDVIVYPTGGGVGLIGIHKALQEMLELGWISGPMPRLVAAQASGCAPIVKAFDEGATRAQPWPDARHDRVRHHGAVAARRRADPVRARRHQRDRGRGRRRSNSARPRRVRATPKVFSSAPKAPRA